MLLYSVIYLYLFKLALSQFPLEAKISISLIFRLECKLVRSNLKSGSHHPKKICLIHFDKSPLNIMKNAFYFILKALFVLKIFKF